MAILDDWARRKGITIVDMGPSERYACLPEEFLDEHHAYPGCLPRILERFWSEMTPPAVSAPASTLPGGNRP